MSRWLVIIALSVVGFECTLGYHALDGELVADGVVPVGVCHEQVHRAV